LRSEEEIREEIDRCNNEIDLKKLPFSDPLIKMLNTRKWALIWALVENEEDLKNEK